MPSGGVRVKKKPAPVPMDKVRCLGVGSLTAEHTFLRPKNSHRRQCESCFARSAHIRGMDATAHALVEER